VTEILAEPEPAYDELDTEELDLTGLVMTGGRPYVLITLMEPEVGGIDVSHAGIDPTVIPSALREIADLLDADA
jgi:hypothetical protein